MLYKTDDVRFDITNPPLARYWISLPLLFLSLDLPTQLPPPNDLESYSLRQRPGTNFVYGNYFLYANRSSTEIILFVSRMMNILLAILLGFVLYRWSKQLYGWESGLLTLALFAFCPNLIAHGSLATTEIPSVASAVLFLYFFGSFLSMPSIRSCLLSSAFLGAAISCKFTNAILVPITVLFLIFVPLRNLTYRLKTMITILAIAWLVICFTYKFENVFCRHDLQKDDWDRLQMKPAIRKIYHYAPLPDSFLRGLAWVAISSKGEGYHPFFMGRYAPSHWYFPVAFLVKTPTVTLLLFLGLFCVLVARKFQCNVQEFLLWVLIGLLLISASLSKINLGLRYILLVYPLLYILTGKVFDLITSAAIPKKVICSILYFLLTAEVLSVAPHYLAFFNRPSGGPEKGMKYLSDSNIDWGQDLKNLAKFLESEGNPELQLSYFGMGVPQYYGIQYQTLPPMPPISIWNHVNSANPEKEFLAVSVTNLQGNYLPKHDLFNWLKKKEPIKKMGYSIYVYDITEDLEAHKKLAEIYQMTGEKEKFVREVQLSMLH